MSGIESILKEFFPHLDDPSPYFEYREKDHPLFKDWKWRYLIEGKTLPKNYCFYKFGDSFIDGTFPGVEIIGFYACDKNFTFYNAIPSRFPDAKLFIILGHPAEHKLQYRLVNHKVIIEDSYKRFFDQIPVMTISNGDEFRKILIDQGILSS